MTQARWLLMVLFLFPLIGGVASAEEPPLLVIYDSSNSMWGELEDGARKYEAGRSALTQALSRIPADRPVALRAYGHRDRTSCTDSELLVPFTASGEVAAAMADAASSIRPTGKTPITYSLKQGLEDLPGGRGEILLISDGIETCDLDPCTLAADWASRGVDVRIHVVGVGLSTVEQRAMACIAEASSGVYLDAGSADELAEAVAKVGERSIEAPEPKPVDREARYALVLEGRDESGRSYIVEGSATRLDAETPTEIDVASHGRNPLPGPGRYRVEAGALLRDGSVYEPNTIEVLVEQPGETRAEITVIAPASVSASFTMGGEPHRGANVTAYRDGQRAFTFRASDEVLAAPGAYTFQSAPERDNDLTVPATLTAGELTVVPFDLVTTVNVRIELVLPGDQRVRRVVTLWQGGEQVYSFHGGHGAQVRPGEYELRSEDTSTPLPAQAITIENEDRTYTVALPAGFVRVRYDGRPEDFTGRGDRAQLKPASGRATYAPAGQPVAVLPGRYVVQPHDAAGYFDPLEITVAEGETTEAVLVAKRTAELIVRYKPDSRYAVEPDRAFVASLDGQPIRKSFLRPGQSVRLLPGRYRVTPWSRVGDVLPVEFEVAADERREVELALP